MSTITTAVEHPKASFTSADDVLTVCAISVLAGILGDVLHEGVGHALLALVTGTRSGVLSTVAWSSPFDSRLVAAGGTLVNLAAGVILWLALRTGKGASALLRYFLLISCAVNLFTGTGYFLFSGVTDFGDWAIVIRGIEPHWLWRTLLVVVGAAAYFAAVLVVGVGFVRYLGVPGNQLASWRRLRIIPYFSTVLLLGVAGLLNPLGIQLVWQSALPASAGANSGLLWLQQYIPQGTVPQRQQEGIRRSYVWITIAGVLGLAFVFLLGRGVTLRR